MPAQPPQRMGRAAAGGAPGAPLPLPKPRRGLQPPPARPQASNSRVGGASRAAGEQGEQQKEPEGQRDGGSACADQPETKWRIRALPSPPKRQEQPADTAQASGKAEEHTTTAMKASGAGHCREGKGAGPGGGPRAPRRRPAPGPAPRTKPPDAMQTVITTTNTHHGIEGEAKSKTGDGEKGVSASCIKTPAHASF